jgi:hypothetical protein
VKSRTRVLAAEQRIIGNFPAFQMGFRASDATLNMTPFLTGRAANRANELQGKIILIHLEVLLRIHSE